jgi:hypothetical protein
MASFLRVQGMFNLRVKTSTPAKSMQLLCLVGVLWSLPFVSRGAVAAPQVVLSSADAAVQAKNASPLEKLHSQVRQWTAQKNGGSADEVQIAPIDNRVQVLACERPLWIDHPFAS